MHRIAALTLIAALFTSTVFHTGCASTKQDAIRKQLDAVSGATKKTLHR
ncbi:MAG: hypothetical protein JXX14_01140 [Deltaproteobacteria bacterium]|nr:hypothetical protein [Deltaproteobacteria bacterium]